MPGWSIRETWLHRTNPSAKLVLCVVMFLLILFTHHINVLVHAAWLLLVLLLSSSGLSARTLGLVLLPFLLLFVSSMTSMVFFGKGETTWLQWGLVHITEESFYRGLHIGFKAVDTALMGLIFAVTTSPVRLFYSFMQQLRIPARYAYSFMAAIRLLPLVAGEYRTLQMALRVRGIRAPRGLRERALALVRHAVPLLAQSIRRAQRIAVAMEAKRFSSASRRTYYYRIGWSVQDAFLLAVLVLLWLGAQQLGVRVPVFDVVDVR